MNKPITEFTKFLEVSRYDNTSIVTIISIVKPLIETIKGNNGNYNENTVKIYLSNCLLINEYTHFGKGHFLKAIMIYLNDYLKNNFCFKEFGQIQYFKKNPIRITIVHINLILKHTKNPKHSIYFKLLFHYGLKLNELINIKIDDIDIKEKRIRIYNKINKTTKNYDLSNSLAMEIEKYLEKIYCSVWLFENKNGDKNTPRCFEEAFKKIIIEAKLDEDITLGAFRNFYGRKKMLENINPLMIKDIMQLKSTSSLKNFKPISNTRFINVPNIYKNKKK